MRAWLSAGLCSVCLDCPPSNLIYCSDSPGSLLRESSQFLQTNPNIRQILFVWLFSPTSYFETFQNYRAKTLQWVLVYPSARFLYWPLPSLLHQAPFHGFEDPWPLSWRGFSLWPLGLCSTCFLQGPIPAGLTHRTVLNSETLLLPLEVPNQFFPKVCIIHNAINNLCERSINSTEHHWSLEGEFRLIAFLEPLLHSDLLYIYLRTHFIFL